MLPRKYDLSSGAGLVELGSSVRLARPSGPCGALDRPLLQFSDYVPAGPSLNYTAVDQIETEHSISSQNPLSGSPLRRHL